MAGIWKLQDAKNRFSEVIKDALNRGPQIVTRYGKETAVILSIEEYRRLARPDLGLVEFLQSSPLREAELDLERSRDVGREVEL